MRQRRLCAILYIIIIGLLSSIETKASEALSRFLENSAIDSTATSVYVADLRTGKVKESYNSSMPLKGASIMKAVTVGALFKSLPIDYRFLTKVYMCGNSSSGVFEGNLLIVGCGDPSLNASCGPASADLVKEITDALIKEGVKKWIGAVTFDEDIFSGDTTPKGWAKEDLSCSYGTGVHGFNFQANRQGKSAVKDPSKVFMSELTKRLSQCGIEYESVAEKRSSNADKKLIVCHQSAPLEDIMRSCMMRSDNLYAECLLRTLAVYSHCKGSTEEGAKKSKEFWCNNNISGSGVEIYDGSGLSRTNRLTALFMGKVLEYMSNEPYYVSFFPLAGQEGTLRNFLKGTSLDDYIALKTGSMRGVQAYAGYKLDDNYMPTHVVVIIINGFGDNRPNVKKATEKFLLEVFENS